MNPAARVFAVCSYDKGFPKFVECLRRDYPEAHITAVVPRGLEVTEGERKHIDDILASSARTLSAFGGLLGLLRLVRAIRPAHAEEIAFQFESAKLRLFGIACRPKRCRAWLGNGQRLELPLSLAATLADLYVHRAKGYGVMLAAAWHAFVLGIASEPPERRH